MAKKQGSELLRHLPQELLNGVFVTFEKMPLADLFAADQAGALQGCQVGGHGRLRQPAALVDLAGTYAVFKVVVLILEIALGVFQPGEDFPTRGVRQGFYYFVQV
jgi:hypothetical protein